MAHEEMDRPAHCTIPAMDDLRRIRKGDSDTTGIGVILNLTLHELLDRFERL